MTIWPMSVNCQWNIAQDVDIPVLILHGDSDPAVDGKAAYQLDSKLTKSRLEIMKMVTMYLVDDIPTKRMFYLNKALSCVKGRSIS